ncbi:MAG: NAD+ synthase, partial [Acidobacteria bacterium]|nr:NAD+ synthase [Acidobacteriota bacterium]
MLRLGLVQMNPTVGALKANAEKILHYMDEARKWGVDLVAFPELALPGYPPEDLLLRPDFVEANQKHLEKIVRASKGLTVLLGFADRTDDVHNAAALIHNGKLLDVHHKHYLPNYGVFDENRYFQAGTRCSVVQLNGAKVGYNICEDIWYPGGPTRVQSIVGGAQVIVNISASPYHAGKVQFREHMLRTRATDYAVIVAFVNLVGGQDELVFDGNSMLIDEEGHVLARGQSFEEDLILADIDPQQVFNKRLHDPRRRKERIAPAADSQFTGPITLPPPAQERKKPNLPSRAVTPLREEAEVYRALVVGTRDYVRKNGFQKVVIGLSGGIDSSLTAVIAVDALGKENVVGISMPSQYTSDASKTDAQKLASNLGIRFATLPIKKAFDAYAGALAGMFSGTTPDVTEENLQSRIRGTLLMALSNKFGWMVLSTGNKSETSVGYATLYGDMAGGYTALK